MLAVKLIHLSSISSALGFVNVDEAVHFFRTRATTIKAISSTGIPTSNTIATTTQNLATPLSFRCPRLDIWSSSSISFIEIPKVYQRVVAIATAISGSEKIKQTFVHGNIQHGAKTKLSKSTVTLHPILAQLLKEWRAETAYAGDNDYVFASRKASGRTPRYGSGVLKDYLRPAAIRAGILELKDGRVYIDGEFVKRFGFHTFRHSLTSWLMANSENPQIVRAMLRWTNLNMLAHYTHGFKADKLEAQGTVLKKLIRSGNPSDREPERELEEVKNS